MTNVQWATSLIFLLSIEAGVELELNGQSGFYQSNPVQIFLAPEIDFQLVIRF